MIDYPSIPPSDENNEYLPENTMIPTDAKSTLPWYERPGKTFLLGLSLFILCIIFAWTWFQETFCLGECGYTPPSNGEVFLNYAVCTLLVSSFLAFPVLPYVMWIKRRYQRHVSQTLKKISWYIHPSTLLLLAVAFASLIPVLFINYSFNDIAFTPDSRFILINYVSNYALPVDIIITTVLILFAIISKLFVKTK